MNSPTFRGKPSPGVSAMESPTINNDDFRVSTAETRTTRTGGDEGLEPVPVPSTPEVVPSSDKIHYDYDDGKEVFSPDAATVANSAWYPSPNTASTHNSPDKPFGQVHVDTRGSSDCDKIAVDEGPAVPPKDEERQGQEPKKKKKKLLIIIGCIVAVLVIVGAVLGGVLGSRKKDGDSDEATSTSTATPSSSATAAASRIQAGSSVGVAAFQRGNSNEIYLSYKDPDNAVKFFKSVGSGGGSFEWKTPALQTPSGALDNVTAMTMYAGIDQSSDPEAQIQVQLLYLDSNAKLKGLNYITDGNSQAQGFTKVPVNDSLINVSPQSDIAAWGPFAVYQDTNNTLSALWFESPTPWKPYTFQHNPVPGSRLSTVPVSRNMSEISGLGWWAVFYQADDGSIQAVIDPGYWPELRAKDLTAMIETWGSTFPKPTIPKKNSFAAFSVARDPNKVSTASKVNTFLLYQDESGDIKVTWIDNDKKWQTAGPDALKGADKDTDISCVTTPAWKKDRTFDDMLLQAASGLTKCYFQKGGKLVEVRLSGSEWVDATEVALP